MPKMSSNDCFQRQRNTTGRNTSLRPRSKTAKSIAPSELTKAEELPSDPGDSRKIEESSHRDHLRIQALLLSLGRELGHQLWVAPDDRKKVWQGRTLEETPGVLPHFPMQFGNELASARVARIDVVWFENNHVKAAFEIESTTKIWTGLMRMANLVAMLPERMPIDLFIVAPAGRSARVLKQISSPLFRADCIALDKKCRLITFERLEEKVNQHFDLLSDLKYGYVESHLTEPLVINDEDAALFLDFDDADAE